MATDWVPTASRVASRAAGSEGFERLRAFAHAPLVERIAAPALAVAWLVAAAHHALTLLSRIPDWTLGVSLGVDRGLYLGAAQRWLDGGSFYQPWQLAGPYAIAGAGEILYPPNALLLFVPFTVLPAVLWWALPIGATILAIAALRPARWTWPILAFLVWYPRTEELVLWGNPSIFVLAFIALACAGLAATGPLVLLKPTLAPFALVGVRRRSWWLTLAVLAAVSVPFGAMWLDWATVVRNASNGGLLYSAADLPVMLLPIVARLGATRRPEAWRWARRASAPAEAAS